MSVDPSQGAHVHLEPGAILHAEMILAAIMENGPVGPLNIDPKIMPTPELEGLATLILHGCEIGRRGWTEFFSLGTHSTDLPQDHDYLRCKLAAISESALLRPQGYGNSVRAVIEYNRVRSRQFLVWKLAAEVAAGRSGADFIAQLAALESEDAGGKVHSMLIHGVMDYPTESPPETILLGNGWARRGDVLTLISTAGAGKSVAVIQSAMAWGLGLPYLGIHPARPLRIVLFSGEDDGVTIGQCREGFLDNSEAITGRKLTAQDLAPLDSMLRIEFIREHVGVRFHAHLASLLRDEPADLVIVNPLLSYLGGEVVSTASEWLRAGLMPILQDHDCAALVAHHTPKLAKDGWENTDDTYSAIGGAELANIPRAILTLRPTGADGLSVLKVSKRQTTGWQDSDGKYVSHFFIRRTDDPTRPAWLPVDADEAQDEIDAGKPAGSAKGTKKATPDKVAGIVSASGSEVARQDLIARTAALCECAHRTAQDAVKAAEGLGLIQPIEKPTGRGGKNAIFYRAGNVNQSLPNQ
jgi:hypothetical protein